MYTLAWRLLNNFSFVRICAGRFLVDNALWIAMARILAVFDITPQKDAKGNPMKPDVKFVTETTRCVYFGSEEDSYCSHFRPLDMSKT